MSGKQETNEDTAGKVDLRNVFVSEETDTRIEEYVLKQKKAKRRVKKGEAAVELIERGLKAEGIE